MQIQQPAGDSGPSRAELEYEIRQLKIESNRAASSTQREADIGKARREQIQASTLSDLPGVSAASRTAVVKNLQEIWGLLPAAACTERRQGAAAGAQQQAMPPPAASVETDAPLRSITMRNKGDDQLKEAEHMQPAAMELLHGMQQALGSSTGLVLADTHVRNHLHNPNRLLDCSGFAVSDRLWSQLVVPFEFRLAAGDSGTADADATFGQLAVTAKIVQCQQPERRFLYAVSITMDTVQVFRFDFRSSGTISRIRSTSPLPFKLHPDSAGLCMLARVVAAPLAQLGFVPASLPEGQLGPHSFTCTARLALGMDFIDPQKHSSCVFMAQLEDKGRAVLKLTRSEYEAEILRRLPQDAKHLVRLLAAGQFDHEQAAWEAVLLEPVVMPLEASMSVQQIAQVTFDIADAVEQLARLMILHCDISPKNIGIQDDGHGCLYDFGISEVVEHWSELSSPVSRPTGTPMYMAIDVLKHYGHSPSTDLESLFYTILDVCTGGHLSDRGADFVDAPYGAAFLRRGCMTAVELQEMQHVPQDKHDFVKTLHNLFFPLVQQRGDRPAYRSHCQAVLPAAVKAACSLFTT